MLAGGGASVSGADPEEDASQAGTSEVASSASGLEGMAAKGERTTALAHGASEEWSSHSGVPSS